jgi:CheY-like chemotaxis protein
MRKPNLRVLLVDPLEDEREMYGEALRSAGFLVEVCEGAGAMAAAELEAPDAIVARLLQPNSSMDGIELVRRFKEVDATRGVPIIIITTRIEADYRRAAEQAGCQAYVLLPATPDEIVAHVRRALAGRRVAARAAIKTRADKRA